LVSLGESRSGYQQRSDPAEPAIYPHSWLDLIAAQAVVMASLENEGPCPSGKL